MHFPEPSLNRCGLACLSGGQCIRMDFLKWTMPKDAPHAAGKALYEQQDDVGRLLARGAFEITILNDGDGGCMGTSNVICS
jgi:hypothetical protein